MTNLIRYSRQLANPLWHKQNLAVADLSSFPGSAPPGYSTGFASRVICMGDTDGSGLFKISEINIPEYSAGVRYTLTVWIWNETWTPDLTLALPGVTGTFSLSTLWSGSELTGAGTLVGSPSWTSPTYTYHPITIAGGKGGGSGWGYYSVSGVTPASPPGGNMSATLSSATGVIGQSFLIGGFALSADTDRTFYDTTTTPRGTQLVPSFNFPFHEVTTKYPANSPAIQFGNSYIFTSKPIGPPQRMFQLTFPALFHYPNADGSMNRAINPLFNADVLDDFYQTVQTWGNFLYIHPRYGQLVCKFSKPLELPKSEGGEAGALKNVQIELVEVPT